MSFFVVVIFNMCICLYMGIHTWLQYSGAAVVNPGAASHMAWVLGTELVSAKAVRAFCH